MHVGRKQMKVLRVSVSWRRGPHRTKVARAKSFFCWGVFSPGLFGRLLASDRLLGRVLQARHLDPARLASPLSLSLCVSISL